MLQSVWNVFWILLMCAVTSCDEVVPSGRELQSAQRLSAWHHHCPQMKIEKCPLLPTGKYRREGWKKAPGSSHLSMAAAAELQRRAGAAQFCEELNPVLHLLWDINSGGCKSDYVISSKGTNSLFCTACMKLCCQQYQLLASHQIFTSPLAGSLHTSVTFPCRGCCDVSCGPEGWMLNASDSAFAAKNITEQFASEGRMFPLVGS